MEDLLRYVHDHLHLPWFATILVVTCCVRVVLVPFNIHFLRNSMRMKVGMRDMKIARDEMEAADTLEEKLEKSRKLDVLFKKYKYVNAGT